LTLSPVSVEKFGGLNLVSDPAEIGWGGAIDLLNVDLFVPGQLSTRPGSETWATPGVGDSYNTLISWYPGPSAFGFDFYVVGGTTKAYVLDSAGGLQLASGAFTGSGGAVQQIDNGVAIGTPSSRRVYVTGYDANSAGCIPQHYNGAAWTTPGTLPKARLLGVTPLDNRLIGANTSATGGPGGATSSESHVWFSDPGAPDTWGANNFVQLTPGDGEPITAIATWRDLVFVFKRSKFFVFYGTSIDAERQPDLQLPHGQCARRGDFAPLRDGRRRRCLLPSHDRDLQDHRRRAGRDLRARPAAVREPEPAVLRDRHRGSELGGLVRQRRPGDLRR
jgi:hypothetical protein